MIEIISPRSLLPLIFVGATLGCRSPSSAEGAASQPDGGAEGSDGAQSAAADAGPSKSCTVESEAVTLDHGVRLDTGVTLTDLGDGRVALGYAGPDGAPKVMVVDEAGRGHSIDALAVHAKSEKKLNAKATRSVLRVTPIAFAGAGKMRVGVDWVDTNPDKTKSLRCGPADTEPFVSETSGENNKNDEEGQVYDCRTFTNGRRTWVLASTGLFSEAIEGEAPMAWLVDEMPGKGLVKDATLDKKRYTSARFDHPDDIVYQVPVGAGVQGVGYVFAARHEGGLVVAQRNRDLQRLGDATRFSLAGPVTMPAIAMRGGYVAIFVGISGKPDLYGSRFTADAKPVKPEKLDLADDAPPVDGDRNSVSASFTPGGSIYAAFADGKAGQKRARLARVSPAMKGTMKVFDVSEPGAVSEVRVHAASESKVLVTYLEGTGSAGELRRTILDCPADPTVAAATPPPRTPPVAASAASAAAAHAAPSAAASSAAKPQKCGKDEVFAQLETGARSCVAECIDPSCNCVSGVQVQPNGDLGSAPGDRRYFCPKGKAKTASKPAVPRCASGQSLFATDDSSPVFCSKYCTTDADCKPSTCNPMLYAADETGTVFAGVGKQVYACDPVSGGAAQAAPAASPATLAIPPGHPAVIPNPGNLPCPPGYGNAGVLKTCNMDCSNGKKCPGGGKCNEALLLCR